MPLTLVKRIPNGAPVSAAQNDANMTAIENSVNTNTTSISTINAGSGSIYTKAQVNAIIAGLPTPTAFDSHPSSQTAAGQTAAPDGTTYTVAGITYNAPVTGTYFVSAQTQFDSGGGGVAVATMEISVGPAVNGTPAGQGDVDSTPSPNGGRWSPAFASIVTMTSGDVLTLEFVPTDGVGAGVVTLTAVQMSVFLLST